METLLVSVLVSLAPVLDLEVRPFVRVRRQMERKPHAGTPITGLAGVQLPAHLVQGQAPVLMTMRLGSRL